MNPFLAYRFGEDEPEEERSGYLLKDWRVKPSSLPGASALKSLYAGGKAIHTAASKLIPGLGTAARVGERVAVKPAIPSEAVEKVAGMIPGAKRESRLLGRLAKDVELGVPSLLALNPLVDFGVSPRDIQALQAQAKPTSPAKIAAGLHEIAAPTIADFAMGGAPLALGMAVRGTEKALGAAKKGKMALRLAEEMKAPVAEADELRTLMNSMEWRPPGKPATEPKRLMGLADPIKRSEVKQVVATNDLKRLGEIEDAELLDAFMDQLPKSKPKKPEILSRTVNLPPMKPENFIDRTVVMNKVLDEGFLRADEVIRHAASLPGQERSRDALIRLADGLVESHRNGEKLVGDTTTEIEQIANVLNSLKGKQRDEAAWRVAKYVQDPDYRALGTGSDILDEMGERLRGTLYREFREGRKAKPDLGWTDDYFPQTKNEDVEKALDQYTKGDEPSALETFRKLYARTNTDYPGDEKLQKWLNQKNVATTQKRGIKSFAESIDLERTMDFPGFWGDVNDPQFTADKMLKALEDHSITSGKRIADAQVFGPEAENFKTLLNSVDDNALQDYIETYRARLLGQSSALEHEKNIVVGALRNVQILNKLGRAFIQNTVQPLITALPYSVNTLGFKKGVKSFGKGMKEAYKGTALAEAQRVGAVNAQVLKDLTAIAEGQPLGGTASRFLDWTLMSKTETANNLGAYHIGKLIAPELADLYWKNPGKRVDVMRRVNRIFDDQPRLAQSFLQSAELGGASALTPELIEEMGYQAAVKTQFRFGAKHLPLFWLTPGGKLLTQFRSFSYNNARFLEKEIIKPAMEGKDVAPLAALAASGLLTGHYTRAMRKALRGERVFEGGINVEETKTEKDKADEGHRKYLREWLNEFGEEIANDAATGISLGLVGDFAAAMERGGKAAPLEFMAGPSLTSASKLTAAAFADKKKLKRIGGVLVDEYLPNPYGLVDTATERGGDLFQRPSISSENPFLDYYRESRR